MKLASLSLLVVSLALVGLQRIPGVGRFVVPTTAPGAWAVSYTPLTYPHPLQASYTDAACTSSDTAASSSRDDVQTKVTAAVDDGCVYIPDDGASVTWATPVTITNKRIQLIGPGEANLDITCTGACVQISNSSGNVKTFRLTAMKMLCDGTDCINMGATSNGIIDGFRIDHITMIPVGSVTHGIQNNAPASGGLYFGLIDHVKCLSNQSTADQISECAIFDPWHNGPDQGGAGCITTNDCNGDAAWALHAPTLGSTSAVVWEDSEFAWDVTDAGNHSTQDTDLGPVNLTFRFNTVDCGSFQTHGARTNHRGDAVYEVYRNTWTGCNISGQRVNLLHDGVAHWFQNTIIDAPNWGEQLTITGYRMNTNGCVQAGSPLLACDGSRAWDGNLEATGWPCLDQIGRLGSNKKVSTSMANSTWEPYKAWSNGTDATCATGGTCDNASHWALNAVCQAGGANYLLSDYYKPYNAPHSNAADALGPANMWDYMDETTGGVTVYTNVGDLPGTCTANTVAWVKNTGSWNASGNGQGSGVLYKCS